MNRATEPSRERDLFEQALDLATPAERDAFLATACGGDAPLLQRVSALLQADEATAAFLPEVPRTTLADISAVDADAPGAIIGRYRLLERIGEGGFGIVYMAEQWEPVRRRVALKLIKPGMDSRQVIGRFEAERQALALMEHPNIAQIFDAGTTEGRARHSVRAGAEPSESGAPGTDAPYLSHGRPYFVMELVRGIPPHEVLRGTGARPRAALATLPRRLRRRAARPPEGRHPSRPQAHEHPRHPARRPARAQGH